MTVLKLKIFSNLILPNFGGAYSNTLKKYLKTFTSAGLTFDEIARHLLILGGFGLHPFDAPSRVILMELIEDRHGKGGIITTSLVPVIKWYGNSGRTDNR